MTSSHDSSRAQSADPCPLAGAEHGQVSSGFGGQVSTGLTASPAERVNDFDTARVGI